MMDHSELNTRIDRFIQENQALRGRGRFPRAGRPLEGTGRFFIAAVWL